MSLLTAYWRATCLLPSRPFSLSPTLAPTGVKYGQNGVVWGSFHPFCGAKSKVSWENPGAHSIFVSMAMGCNYDPLLAHPVPNRQLLGSQDSHILFPDVVSYHFSGPGSLYHLSPGLRESPWCPVLLLNPHSFLPCSHPPAGPADGPWVSRTHAQTPSPRTAYWRAFAPCPPSRQIRPHTCTCVKLGGKKTWLLVPAFPLPIMFLCCPFTFWRPSKMGLACPALPTCQGGGRNHRR